MYGGEGRHGVRTPHKDWMVRRTRRYVNGLDYTCDRFVTSPFGTGIKPIQYRFSLDMAQQIAMMEDTEQGDIEGLDYTWRKFAPSPFGTGIKPIEYHFSLDMAQQTANLTTLGPECRHSTIPFAGRLTTGLVEQQT